MEPIKSIVNNVIRNIQKRQQCPKEKIEEVWTRCVKKSIAQHTRVHFLKNGKLYINTENPAWSYELKIKKDAIIQRLQKASENKIKDIRFKVGDIHGSRK